MARRSPEVPGEQHESAPAEPETVETPKETDVNAEVAAMPPGRGAKMAMAEAMRLDAQGLLAYNAETPEGTYCAVNTPRMQADRRRQGQPAIVPLGKGF
jgi:hypothetical protein